MIVIKLPSPWLTTSFQGIYAVASLVVALFFLLFFARALETEGKAFRPLDLISNFVSKRYQSWAYLFYGPQIIQDKFDQSNGKPFEVFAPDNRYVFVSSLEHMKELDNAADTVLSLQAASKQMLQPVYTMHGFNWFDRRGTEGVGFVKALRTLLTNNLPQILPDLSVINRTRLAELLEQHPAQDGKAQSPVYRMIVKLVVLSNAVSFFGKDLAKDGQFMVSALAYIEETLLCAEVVRLIPRFMAPSVGKIIANRFKSHEVIFNMLLSVAEQRCQERDSKLLGQEVPYHADCIQWIMETSPRQKPWTAKRVVHELMAIWFGSVHALSTTITFAIHDLCLRPEYVEPLRQELTCEYEDFERTAIGLPLLDSFIKESARLTPVESMSTRRSALMPFKFSDGTKLEVNDWACTPVRAIMTDPRFYPAPLEFNGFRFASPEIIEKAGANSQRLQASPSQFTDVDGTFHVWGTGRMACPGRYYATAVMKVILGQIIMNYDIELVNRDAPRWFTWRSSMLPSAKTMVFFSPLEV
ncbi:cytochrome P450 [Hypoxylon cercidicola]|nr:cytochrome P450 [Hypoxylon cercidicola]